MTTIKVSFELEESIFKSISMRFPDIADKEKLVSALAKLAICEWELWFSARLRPKSISALNQERIQMIYQNPSIYLGKQVTRGVLFNQFNLPYGEAAYLERVFVEKDTPELRNRSLRKLIKDLESQIREWEKDKKHKQDQGFTIEVDKLGEHIVQSIMQKVKEEGREMAPHETALSVHGFFNYTFSKNEAEMILETAKNYLKVYE